MRVNILPTIERDGLALPLAKLKDRAAVVEVARRCIEERRLEAAEVCRNDAELGSIARGELQHTERMLNLLIPELRFP